MSQKQSRRARADARRQTVAPLAGEIVTTAEPVVDPAIFAPLDTHWVDEPDPSELDPDPDSDAVRADTAELALDGLTIRGVTVEDVDRLWDWIRQDEDGGKGFLGIIPRTSLELHRYFLQVQEKGPAAAAFAVDDVAMPVGIVLFDPIDPQRRTAGVHLYLEPSVRGSLVTLTSQLLAICDAEYPHLTLLIATTTEAQMRLYRSLGFTVAYVLTRPAKGVPHG